MQDDTIKHKQLQERVAVETAVKGFVTTLRDRDVLFKNTLAGVKILVLSCDKSLRVAVKERLRKDGYTAFVIDETKPMFPHLPEFEVEKSAIDWVNVIVVVEDERVEDTYRCPGLVQECTIIMSTPKYQNKAIYVCPSTIKKEVIRDVTGGHYLYFPHIEQIDYGQSKEKLVEEICSIAKKEAHRIAHAFSNNAGQTMPFIPPETNICHGNNTTKGEV